MKISFIYKSSMSGISEKPKDPYFQKTSIFLLLFSLLIILTPVVINSVLSLYNYLFLK